MRGSPPAGACSPEFSPPPAAGTLIDMSWPGVPTSVAPARAALRRALTGCAELPVDDLEMIVSELVTNAATHGAGHVRLVARRTATGLRIEVSDDGADEPVLRELTAGALSGRGLAIVAALSTAWGTIPRPPGKIVWAEVRC